MLNLLCSVDSTNVARSVCCESLRDIGRVGLCITHGINLHHEQKKLDIKSLHLNDEQLGHLERVEYSAVVGGSEIFLGTKEGTLLRLAEEPQWTLEIAYVLKEGLSCLSLSPDESELALLSSDASLLVLLNVYYLEDDSPNRRIRTSECSFAHVPTLGTDDDDKSGSCRPHISWRSDGLFFAVAFSKGSERWVHIYDRQGALTSCMEHLSGHLGSGISWRPNKGSLIALHRRLPSGKDVLGFIEKNGLAHGEIPLELKGLTPSIDPSWNSSGTILCLSLLNHQAHEQCLHLLMSSNYTWETKFVRTLSLQASGGVPYSLLWDESDPFLLTLSSPTASITLHFTLQTSQSDFLLKEDRYRNLAVIDGYKVKLTPLALLRIPPPSSAYELRFPSYVRGLTFGRDLSLSVLLEDGSLHVFEYGSERRSQPIGQEDILHPIDLPTEQLQSIIYSSHAVYHLKEPINFVNLTWIGPGKYLGSFGSTLVVLGDHGETFESHELPENILNITYSPENSIIQLTDGSLFSYTSNAPPFPYPYLKAFPRPCPEVQVLRDSKILLGLSRSHRLYANGEEIASQVNSFARTKDFLLLCTDKHELKVYSLSNLRVPEAIRSLERGSRIILAHSPSVVLQMPRGNLEFIAPRPCVLHDVIRELESFAYAGVLPLLKRHRINLNILVDHNPTAFWTHAEEFLDVIEAKDACVFISELLNEDVTRSIYKGTYRDRARGGVLPWGENNKVDALTSEFLRILRGRRDEARILPMLACHIKHSERRVSAALKIVNDLRTPSTSPELAERTLPYLSLILDPQELFNGALSTYDLDFVVFVASKATSKDPKEYVPYLNQLKSLAPLALRHYTIEKHLQSWESALAHAASPEFPSEELPEILSLVSTHRLYAKALRLLRARPEFTCAIYEAYGNYLCSKKYYRDAALAFDLGGHPDRAAEAWALAGHPRRALSGGSSCSEALAVKCVEVLKAGSRYEEAAEVYLTYLKHPEEAIVAYLEGGLWERALEIINRLGRKDMLEINFKPCLSDKLSEQLAFIKESRKTFESKLSRFKAVLESRKRVKGLPGDDCDDAWEGVNDAEDAFSERSAVSAASSRRSARSLNTLLTKASSSRDKRKLNKKLYSSKEGSEFEDIAIVAEMHALIGRAYAAKDETSSLLTALVEMNQIDEARSLQRELKDLLGIISRSLKSLWIKDPVEEEPQEGKDDEIYIPPYGLLEDHLRYPPKDTKCSSGKGGLEDTWEIQLLNE